MDIEKGQKHRLVAAALAVVVAVVVANTLRRTFAAQVSEDTPFGTVMRIIMETHPRLGMSRGSHRNRFCFSIGDGPKFPPAGVENFPVTGGFIQAEVLRKGNAHAALLLLPEGDCAYYTSDGKQSFLALADSSHPKTILYSLHGGIIVYGILTKPAFKKRQLLDSEMFMITTSDSPRMFLRILGFIKAKMFISNQIHFRSRPTPTLDLNWSHSGEAYSMYTDFTVRAGAVLPIRHVHLICRKSGKVVMVGWVRVGGGKNRGHVVIHRVAGLKARSDLPWKSATPTEILHDSLRSIHTSPGTVRLDTGYLALRRRFIRWATTSGVALPRKERGATR